MFLDAAILATLAAVRWHQARRHNQQVAAAQRALCQLQSAYIEAAAVPMAALAQQRPPQLTVERHIAMVRQVVPEYAEKIVEDTAFDALTATLVQAQEAGHAPEQILRTAIGRRTLADTEHPAGFSPGASNASSPARHPVNWPVLLKPAAITGFLRGPARSQRHGCHSWTPSSRRARGVHAERRSSNKQQPGVNFEALGAQAIEPIWGTFHPANRTDRWNDNL